MTAPSAPVVIAYHGTEGTGGAGNPMVLVVFLAVIVTGGWLLFSNLSWRNTMAVTVAVWLAVVALAFAL